MNKSISDISISIIGVGKLGLSFALNLEKKGYDILGIDKLQSYADNINNRTLKSDEPFVEEYLKTCKNLYVITDVAKALVNDIIFVVVATPSLKNGTYDHSQIDSVVKTLKSAGKQNRKKYLVISCTVMPGYCSTIDLKDYNYEVIYNPEFIAQGSIIRDQLNPDIILLGSESEEAINKIELIYKNLCENIPRVCKMSLMESEITKIALNCFLTTKIAYANMVGDVAQKTGCNPDVILEAIGKDSRIGSKYLKYGYGYGGPCFPRDNKAFSIFCESAGSYAYNSMATDQSNKAHLIHQVEYFKKNNNKETPVFIEGVSYKKGSSILEESQQLLFALELMKDGYDVTIKDNKFVVQQLKKLYGNKFRYIIE